MSQNKLETMDAETLLSTPMEPIIFIVEGLLSQGLHILAGAPKIGKSWLYLWMCLQITKGESIWELKTEKKEVLCLCLEDSFNRIQEGLVILPPFGYFKDKNTGEVQVVQEAVDTVHLIFSLYLMGHGFKFIAKELNQRGCKTPGKIQLELLRKKLPSTHDKVLKKYLWDGTMVKRILLDESYTGTLICHKSERNKINKTFRHTDAEEQFRHENYFPPVITKEQWEEVQASIESRKINHARAASGQAILRYSGLLRCADCGRTFVGKRIKNKSGHRVEYHCDTYHRYGKEHCTNHAICENVLDEIITRELISCQEQYHILWAELESELSLWLPNHNQYADKIKKSTDRMAGIEEELEVILMERIKDKANADRYDRMIQKREAELQNIREEIERLEHMDEVLRKRQSTLKRDIRLMEDILKETELTGSQLRLLVEKIYISEVEGKLDLKIELKAPFQNHKEEYETLKKQEVSA